MLNCLRYLVIVKLEFFVISNCLTKEKLKNVALRFVDSEFVKLTKYEFFGSERIPGPLTDPTVKKIVNT